MINIVFIGPPGSGKGTQSKRLSFEYGLNHISFGDILRSHIENKSEIGREVKDLLEQGQLVGNEIMHRILEEQLKIVIAEEKGFILDGFPRNLEQAELLEGLVDIYSLNIAATFFLDVPLGVVENRLYKRAEIEMRKDDISAESVKKRLSVYKEEVENLCEFYKKRGKFHHIDGNSHADDVFYDIKKILSI